MPSMPELPEWPKIESIIRENLRIGFISEAASSTAGDICHRLREQVVPPTAAYPMVDGGFALEWRDNRLFVHWEAEESGSLQIMMSVDGGQTIHFTDLVYESIYYETAVGNLIFLLSNKGRL